MGGSGKEASACRCGVTGLSTLLFAALPVWERGSGV